MAFYGQHLGLASPRKTSFPAQRRVGTPARGAVDSCLLALAVVGCVAVDGNTAVESKTYSNQAFRYTVTYPAHWLPSGLTYANAFEVRNYDRSNPELVGVGNRASLMIVDTINENGEATERFLDSLPGPQQTPSLESQALRIAGRRAVMVRRVVPGQPVSKGALQTSPAEVLKDNRNHLGAYLAISTYVGNGKHMIALEASAPAEADESVIREIMAIERSVRFEDSNQPASTKPNPRKK